VSIEYATTLNDYGFTTNTDDLYDTITAYVYEINGVLFDEDSPFIADKSETLRQPNNLNSLVHCTLPLKAGGNISEALSYLIAKWYQWLRQSNPILENIESIPCDEGTRIRILTIAEYTACTIEFKIIQHP